MSDKEVLLEMFKTRLNYIPKPDSRDDDNHFIIEAEWDNDKVNGYTGFVCRVEFDENDNLKSLGVFE